MSLLSRILSVKIWIFIGGLDRCVILLGGNRLNRFIFLATALSRQPVTRRTKRFFMAIYLDEQTGPMLKTLLKRELLRLPSNFVADRLLKMVISDDERKAKISSCEHDWNPMTGHKTQCNKCGGLKDGFEEYTSDEFIKSQRKT